MVSQIKLGDIAVDVVLKDIKNVYLRVHPPTGSVRISAPKRMSIDTIRVFAVSKLDWIKQQQTKLREQERESRREYLDGESHYVWGRRCLLSVIERCAPPAVELQHRRLRLFVRPGMDAPRRAGVLEAWYRDQLRAAAQPIIVELDQRLGVQVEGLSVRKMRTRWGSCSPAARTIRLNTDLARKPRECLEYVVAHELTHLLEPTHNAHFVGLMDRLLPGWQHRRESLNRLPLRHEDWGY